jgi:hypothetical protein
MKKQIILTFFALVITGLVSIPALAKYQTHSIWTNDNGLVIVDAKTHCEYTSLAAFDMATSWTEPTPGYAAMAHFRGVSKAYGLIHGCADHFYEFTLIKTASTSTDDIQGAWDVYRDGTLMCSACDGIAYGLSQSTGLYYKVVIYDPVFGAYWNYIGYIDQRKDF